MTHSQSENKHQITTPQHGHSALQEYLSNFAVCSPSAFERITNGLSSDNSGRGVARLFRVSVGAKPWSGEPSNAQSGVAAVYCDAHKSPSSQRSAKRSKSIHVRHPWLSRYRSEA